MSGEEWPLLLLDFATSGLHYILSAVPVLPQWKQVKIATCLITQCSSLLISATSENDHMVTKAHEEHRVLLHVIYGRKWRWK